jgi:crotonobetainyl-CoA:carnitine CoA-transferase CaiB-like acyl-CoA transferase
MSYDAPYRGIKVIDLSQGIAGPYCGMLLAQNGAEVIKVEPVVDGDWSRLLGRRYRSHTAFSIAGNLGKQSLALDLKSDEGKAVLWRLIESADVVMEGFRPGVIKRLGFDYAAVSARAPRILYLSISGFGQTGPLSERPAMDPVLQAYTGLMMENKGEDGLPHRFPIIAIDMATGLYAYQAVSSALYARRDEAHGRYIETSLMQTGAAFQVVRMMATYLEGGPMQPGAAPSTVFRTADGYISVNMLRNTDWVNFCAALDMPDLATEPRFVDNASRCSNDVALYGILRPAMAEKSTSHWTERFLKAGIMHERLNSYQEFLQQHHVAETGLIGWLNVPGVPKPVPVPNVAGAPPLADGKPYAHAPALGEHTEAILRRHGYSAADIAGLAARQVIGGVQTAAA